MAFDTVCDLPNTEPLDVYFTGFVPTVKSISDVSAVSWMSNQNNWSYLIITKVWQAGEALEFLSSMRD